MPPKKKWKSNIILFDVNCNPAFKAEAIKCFLSITGDTYFSKSRDYMHLYLMNAAKRLGPIDEKTQYVNVFAPTTIKRFSPLDVNYIEEASSVEGNWLEGVRGAVDALTSQTKNECFDGFQLIVLTDFSTPLKMEQRAINSMVKSIQKDLCILNGYIYFLGPDILIPKMLRTKDDIYKWARNIDVGDNVDLQIAYSILEECNGVMCSLEDGKALFKSYVLSKNGFPFTAPLTFQNCDISTAGYKFIEIESLLKPKRSVEGTLERVYVYADDTSEEVDEDNIIGGLALHKKLVIIPPDVGKGVKKYNRFFKLLGFTDAKNVPVDIMMASSTNLISTYKDTNIRSINYVIKVCHELNQYGIALRAYMKNTRPKLYCLIPKLDPLHFIAVELPFAEAFNVKYNLGDKNSVKFKPECYPDYDNVDELKDNIYKYLDGVKLNDRIKIHPALRGNPNKQRIVTNLVRKIRGEDILPEKLPLGDFDLGVDENKYNQVNEKWFARNEVKID